MDRGNGSFGSSARTAGVTTTVNINDVAKEELESGEVVYTGRQRALYMWKGRYYLPRSDWANPFKVDVDGTAEECVAKYERYLYEERPDLVARLPELRGKRLACWCKPDEACHAALLAWLADGPLGQRR